MWCRHREVQEKWLVLVFINFFQNLISQLVQNVLMMEVLSGWAFSPVFLSGSYGFTVWKLGETIVFNVDIRRHIQRTADTKVIVKAICHRGILNGSAIIHPFAGVKIRKFCKFRCLGEVHSQMPFADHCCVIALFLEKICHGLSSFFQKRFGITADYTGFQAGSPVIAAGKDAVSGRGTNSRRGVCICETETVFAHVVQIRCCERTFLIKSTDISISHIICKDIDHVWFLIHFRFLRFSQNRRHSLLLSFACGI